jgi:hypothetical protein
VERWCDNNDEELDGARGMVLLAVGTLGTALAFRLCHVVSDISLSNGKAAQWEGALQEVRPGGVRPTCMAELATAMWVVKSTEQH